MSANQITPPGDQHQTTVPGLFSPDPADGRVQVTTDPEPSEKEVGKRAGQRETSRLTASTQTSKSGMARWPVIARSCTTFCFPERKPISKFYEATEAPLLRLMWSSTSNLASAQDESALSRFALPYIGCLALLGPTEAICYHQGMHGSMSSVYLPQGYEVATRGTVGLVITMRQHDVRNHTLPSSDPYLH